MPQRPVKPSSGLTLEQRQHVMRGILCAAAVGATWYFVARPMEAGLRFQQSAFAATQAQLRQHEATLQSEPNMAPTIRSMSDRLHAITTWAAKSGDTGGLYEAFRDLAAKTGVRIEVIEPNGARQPSRPSGGRSKTDLVTCELAGYTIDISGSYEAIARFIGACDTQLGASKVVSFRMSPAPGSPPGEPASVVVASVETVHLRLVVNKRSYDPDGDNTGGR